MGIALIALAAPAGAAADGCPGQPVRPTVAGTYPAGCYVYEKVSPADKGNGEVAGGGVLITGFRTSVSGDHVIYPADSVFLGATTFPQVNAYYAWRSADGWKNSALGAQLPVELPADRAAPIEEWPDGELPPGLSDNGRWTVLGSNLVPGTRQKVLNRGYAVNLQDQTVTRITPPTLNGDHPVALESGYSAPPVVVGDNERTILPTGARLTPDSLDLVGEFDTRIYNVENGTTTLVSRLPDGQPSNGMLADQVVGGPRALRRWSVASDGKTLWWTIQLGGPAPIYRGHVDAPSSDLVTRSENPADAAVGTGIAVGGSVDGRRAAFVSNQPLTAGLGTESAGRLFLYTHSDDPAVDRNLTLISADGNPADTTPLSVIPQTAQLSEDGRTAYFWTTGKQLVPGGPVGPGQKLYRWHDGQLDYLATGTVALDDFGVPVGLSLTATGRHYAFDTDADLTGEPTGGLVQRYVYDAQSDQISCVSCGNAASAAIGGIAPLTEMNLMQQGPNQRRYLSTAGHVFFVTSTALVPQDTNGLVDVYAWQDGKVQLISSGRSSSDVRFADASADGSTVFFSTRDRLSAWDVDSRADLYVARRDGGIPEPNERPVEGCVGDACQGDVPAPPTLPLLGTAIGAGAGDVPLVPWKRTAKRVSVARTKTVRGTATTLRVKVPGKGSLRVSGNGVVAARKSAKKASTVRVRVRLSRASKKRLARTGRRVVRVSVRYRPTDGATQTLRRSITFRTKKKAKGTSRTSSSRTAGTKGGR
ncbi:MAG: hypothetical protein ITG02_13810 [Patulibacter sp.]|nr:hypothetical protein [Patulibacter sp.]